jgi:hypothetical protein
MPRRNFCEHALDGIILIRQGSFHFSRSVSLGAVFPWASALQCHLGALSAKTTKPCGASDRAAPGLGPERTRPVGRCAVQLNMIEQGPHAGLLPKTAAQAAR